jgi:hypothetical protein
MKAAEGRRTPKEFQIRAVRSRLVVSYKCDGLLLTHSPNSSKAANAKLLKPKPPHQFPPHIPPALSSVRSLKYTSSL